MYILGHRLNLRKVKNPYFIYISIFLVTIIASVAISTRIVNAQSSGNLLVFLGQNCNDMEKNSDEWTVCEKVAQKKLNENLGCSGEMFSAEKIRNDPNNPDATETRYFTKPAEYQKCYDKAATEFKKISGTSCSTMRHGWDDNGKFKEKDDTSWKNCERIQKKLHETLGCSKEMFKESSKKHYYTQKSEEINDCKKRLDEVLAVNLKGPNGSTSRISADDSTVTTTDKDGNTTTTVASTAPGDVDQDNAKVCNGDTIGWLSWIVCPVVKASITAVEGMDNAINTLLTIDTDQIFNTADEESSGARYKQAWSVFRSIALGIVIIASLIIIISTAFGYEILDAYTLRKLLPRILISIIFITLSWSVMNFLIVFTNDIGNGIRALIYLPFQGMNGVEFGVGDSTNVLTTLMLGGAAISLGAIGLLSLVVTAVLAVIIAFLVLVLRELIIIVLIIMAPIGIACLILPNTRKGWQIWQNTLTVMLVVFPIISAIIATGRVFSMTVSNGGSSENIVNQLIAFAAYILPYFMLPFAFRMAGGAMATLAGLANDRSRGAFDRLKNYRGNKMQENFGKMKSGNRFADRNMATRAFNRTTSNVGMGVQGGFGMGERGRQARAQLEEISALDQVMKNPKWQGVNQNDDALRALTYGSAADAQRGLTEHFMKDGKTSEAEASARANRAVQAAQASVRFGRPQQVAAARQLVSTGTGYDDVFDMQEVLGRASGGNMNTAASLAGFANSETKKTGRGDLAPSFGTLENMVQDKGKTGKPGVKPVNKNEVMQNAWESVSLYQHGNGKPTAIKNFAKHYEDRLHNGTHEQKAQALTFFKDLENMKSGANGAVAGEINKILDRNARDIADVSSQPARTSPLDADGLPRKGSGGVEMINNEPVPIRDASGTVTGYRDRTLGDHARQRARTYRDPNIADRT